MVRINLHDLLLFIFYIKYLTNITIKKLEDKNFKPYFLIINNNNQEESCFCFEWTLKEGWTDLVNNWESIKNEFCDEKQKIEWSRFLLKLAKEWLMKFSKGWLMGKIL